MWDIWNRKFKDLPFEMPSRYAMERKRNLSFEDKEPETIEWIRSFSEKSIFWDIGANIGVFSLWAGSLGHRVHSFEPDRENFERLGKGISWNDFKIYFLPYALSDFDGESIFHVPIKGVGLSGGQIGNPVGEDGQEFKVEDSYSVRTNKIDTLAERLGVPNYIKIDVDGQEVQILKGGYQTLGKPEVRGVLVEINNNHDLIENYMIGLGFTGFNKFNGADINRRSGQKSYNRIYTRT